MVEAENHVTSESNNLFFFLTERGSSQLARPVQRSQHRDVAAILAQEDLPEEDGDAPQASVRALHEIHVSYINHASVLWPW